MKFPAESAGMINICGVTRANGTYRLSHRDTYVSRALFVSANKLACSLRSIGKILHSLRIISNKVVVVVKSQFVDLH